MKSPAFQLAVGTLLGISLSLMVQADETALRVNGADVLLRTVLELDK